MSAMFSAGARDGCGPEASSDSSSSSLERLPSTSRKRRISTPSSPSVRENGGMDPGEIPPISAWCARLAVKKSRRGEPSFGPEISDLRFEI
jgi:hypothetical protein